MLCYGPYDERCPALIIHSILQVGHNVEEPARGVPVQGGAAGAIAAGEVHRVGRDAPLPEEFDITEPGEWWMPEGCLKHTCFSGMWLTLAEVEDGSPKGKGSPRLSSLDVWDANALLFCRKDSTLSPSPLSRVTFLSYPWATHVRLQLANLRSPRLEAGQLNQACISSNLWRCSQSCAMPR